MSTVYSKKHVPKDTNSKEKSQRHKKDFSWEERTANPFKQVEVTSELRTRVSLVLLFLSVCATVGIIFFHSFFQINTVYTEGIHNISEPQFREAAIGIANSYKTGYIVPGTNYFFVKTDKLEEILLERFPVATVSITKEFPNVLHIAIQEKVSTIIYDDEQMYSYIGTDGTIVESIRMVGEDEWNRVYETVTSTREDGSVSSSERLVSESHIVAKDRIQAEMGEYPILHHTDKTGTSTTPVSEIAIQNILVWYNEFKKDILFDELYYVKIGESGRETQLMLDPYRYITINALEPAETQLARLRQIMHEVNLDTVNYLDLRFEGRVYWQ